MTWMKNICKNEIPLNDENNEQKDLIKQKSNAYERCNILQMAVYYHTDELDHLNIRFEYCGSDPLNIKSIITKGINVLVPVFQLMYPDHHVDDLTNSAKWYMISSLSLMLTWKTIC